MVYSGEKIVSSINLGKTWYLQKNEIRTLSHTTHKNQLKIFSILKLKTWNCKIRKEKTEKLRELGLDNDNFDNLTICCSGNKSINRQIGSYHLKSFLTAKQLIQNMK
jgi:hypothetical protein